MYCGECGSQMSGRIKESKNERHYFCPNKTRNWKKNKPTEETRYKRGKIDGYGCDMNRSLNIPITDEFVWNSVRKVVSESSTLKEGFKKEVLHSKFATEEEIKTELKNQKTKSKRWMTELQQIQSSIADVETNNLLRKYDAEVYEKIIGNLNAELDKTKEEIEQTRLRIKELGKEQKWLDWVQKYADQVDELDTYSDEQKKEYLDGIIDRIEVRLDQETKDHHLDIIFRLPLVGDGIEYVDKNNKSAGYELVDGDTTTTTTVSHELVKSMGVDARRLGRKQEVAKKKEMNQLTPEPHNNITVE